MTGAARLTAEQLQRLSAFVYRQTGMLFGETKRYYIERRLAERYTATGIGDFASYLGHLRSDATERETLVNAFTINETYFYREEHQLACLSRALLPALIATRRPGDKIRIWSLPCSTGEEAYSIAIWLLENWRLVDAYNIEIIGSDIDTRALEAAREGLYGERALSRLPPRLRDCYFEPVRRHRRRIIRDLRESVSFAPANLVDAASMAVHGVFDVIFCRNVLIYFDDESRLLAAGTLYDRLAPGGFLCLGHTESMSRISPRFEICRFEDATVFQRPADA
ncbi:CheR family methyltransferase [Falsiroseomonas tokyonensis]|uniref:CheR family methyltransferase n=1 Tax=Falsiroseomonas tokyonensis TaxID=430521 RepID=A0ABV7BZE6_9PROT|nr:protein-glutamate O-methyltransferase CheR [Falsiroseomonas tokyonensis]MBU8540622.1 protein-glutamate O-methyltransferase CheR [Falsiroseomonas tokyonensis]